MPFPKMAPGLTKCRRAGLDPPGCPPPSLAVPVELGVRANGARLVLETDSARCSHGPESTPSDCTSGTRLAPKMISLRTALAGTPALSWLYNFCWARRCCLPPAPTFRLDGEACSPVCADRRLARPGCLHVARFSWRASRSRMRVANVSWRTTSSLSRVANGWRATVQKGRLSGSASATG
jgi:hypothetical protein